MHGNFRRPSGVWISLPRELQSGFGFVSIGKRRLSAQGETSGMVIREEGAPPWTLDPSLPFSL